MCVYVCVCVCVPGVISVISIGPSYVSVLVGVYSPHGSVLLRAISDPKPIQHDRVVVFVYVHVVGLAVLLQLSTAKFRFVNTIIVKLKI